MTRLLALLVMLPLAACASWPEEGRGGLAERRADAIGTPRLSCLLDEVAALEGASAEAGRATGQAALLRRTADRARRETDASLSQDATRTMDRLGAESAALRQLLGRPSVSGCA